MVNSNEYSAALLLKGTPNVHFFLGFYTVNCIPKFVLSVIVSGRFSYFFLPCTCNLVHNLCLSRVLQFKEIIFFKQKISGIDLVAGFFSLQENSRNYSLSKLTRIGFFV